VWESGFLNPKVIVLNVHFICTHVSGRLGFLMSPGMLRIGRWSASTSPVICISENETAHAALANALRSRPWWKQGPEALCIDQYLQRWRRGAIENVRAILRRLGGAACVHRGTWPRPLATSEPDAEAAGIDVALAPADSLTESDPALLPAAC